MATRTEPFADWFHRHYESKPRHNPVERIFGHQSGVVLSAFLSDELTSCYSGLGYAFIQYRFSNIPLSGRDMKVDNW